MWKKLINSEYFLDFKSNLEVFITNYVSIWHLQFTEASFLACLKDSNFGLEMNDDKFIQNGKKMLSQPEELKTTRISEENNYLVVQMTMSFGFPLKLEMKLNEGSKELFFTMITIQLVKTVLELHSSQAELRQLLRRKDREIEEYRCEGGDLALRFLKTIPFDDSAHSSQHPTLRQHFSEADLEELLNKTVNVPELQTVTVKHETVETNNGTNIEIKIEHTEETNYVERMEVPAVEVQMEPEFVKVESCAASPAPSPGGKRRRGKLNLYDEEEPYSTSAEMITQETDSSDNESLLLVKSKQKCIISKQPYSTSPERITQENDTSDSDSESLLPAKSKEKYIIAYRNFIHWKRSRNERTFSEDVFLAYFNELATKYKPSSLWCIHSKLKSIVGSKKGVDLKSYRKLTELLKSLADGYVGRKSKILTQDEVQKFLEEAPDRLYLATKVALIFGITGACKRQELSDITTKDIEDHGKTLQVRINNTKNKMERCFTIHGPCYDIVKKYEALRTTTAKSDRFFQNYQRGKCTSQPIGRNKFGSMPKEIATFLGLPEAEMYTGHSFRGTAAAMEHDD